VQAGATLKSVQDAADEAGRLFPLSLASEGSCRIGGNLSTNAGGLNVLAYGNARDLCLGLEVVLPDGRIWNGLRRLRKDNTGYDLKNMFIGAEGTLGVITAAVLKLFPKPRSHETAFIAVTSPQAAVDVLSLAKEMSGNRVVAFELLPRIAMDFTVKHMGISNPLVEFSPWYALSELADPPAGSFEAILEEAMTRGLVTDATVAQSEGQRQALWAIRELMPESQKFEGGSIKHDVSVPVSKIPQFIIEATRAVENYMPQARVMSFGHMGDGNLHFNVSQPLGMDKKKYLDLWNEMNAVVFDVVLKFDGSISAEHGIGRLKKHHMPEIKSAVELQMMRDLKKLFDPTNIMNPGKVLP
jgi:FAD/FMN-containing dehydrogenase